MNRNRNFRYSMAVLLATGVLGLMIPAMSNPLPKAPQRPRAGGGRVGPPPRMSGGGGGGQFHAGRDAVRTGNYVGQTQGGGYQRMPPVRQNIPARPMSGLTRNAATGSVSSGVQSQRSFTVTVQGRTYDNGLNLRRGRHVNQSQANYFPYGYSYFPGYYQGSGYGQSVISPWAYFFGVNSPYINTSYAVWYPPAVNFVDIPTYTPAKTFAGFSRASVENLINDPNIYKNEPGLSAALDDIVEAFQGKNIDGLVSVVEPNVSVAVYTGGHYDYSMAAHNFVDLTRDTIKSTQTTSFQLQSLHERSPSVFCVSGEHDYKDRSGAVHSVYVSFVLQDISGQWTITQVGTAPEVLRNI